MPKASPAVAETRQFFNNTPVKITQGPYASLAGDVVDFDPAQGHQVHITGMHNDAPVDVTEWFTADSIEALRR